MELTRVTLPPVTQECLDNRIPNGARCSLDLQTQVGNPLGACGESPHALKKVIGAGLYDLTYNNDAIPPALYSPAYETLKAFQISGAETGELFDFWIAPKNQTDPRVAVCDWVIENFERVESFIPRTYPRVIMEGGDDDDDGASQPLDEPLSLTSTILASLAIVVVTFTALLTYVTRNRPVMQYAQLEFLTLLLLGLTLVSVGSLLMSFPPTDGLCVTAIWLTNFGYTLELVPLIVKMGAFYRLMKAAKRLRHVQLSRQSLFGAVLLLSAVIVIFLIVWTVMDPPRRQTEYELSDELTPYGEGIVQLNYFCKSESSGWIIASVFWHLFLLVVATVQAFQTRTIRREVNESQTLAIMIYSHFMFVCLRLGTFFLERSLSESDMMQTRSIIFSLDCMVAVALYFGPKFCSDDSKYDQESSEHMIGSQTVKQLRMLAAVATTQHERQINRLPPSSARRGSEPQHHESGVPPKTKTNTNIDSAGEEEQRRLSLHADEFKAHLRDAKVLSISSTEPSSEEDNSPPFPSSHKRCSRCGKFE